MQKLNLTKRPAKIGKSVNTRTEMHGTDEVPGQDIPLSGIVLNGEDLCAITDEPSAMEGFFKHQEGQFVPRILALDPVTLSHKFVGATVKMSGGGIPVTTYKNAKIKNIVLEPQLGGMTLMACTLQVNPDNGDPSAQQLINAKISLNIKAQLEQEQDDEPELPLDHQDSAGAREPDANSPEDLGFAESSMSKKTRRVLKGKKVH